MKHLFSETLHQNFMNVKMCIPSLILVTYQDFGFGMEQGHGRIPSQFPSAENMTKRMLVSDIAKVFDVLGWFSPAKVTMKILLQQLWELQIDWDNSVPKRIENRWR